jgi:hypothetical protein
MAISPFEGFEFARSSDVLELQNQQFQQGLASGDKDKMRAAVFQQMSTTMAGGTPLFKQAKKTENILQQAQREAHKTGDDIADQISYFREAQRLAVENELPEIAMQATSKLAALTTVQEERDRLKARESRDVEAHEQATDQHNVQLSAMKTNLRHLTNGVLLDPDTLEIVERIDQLSPEDIQKRAELQKANPRLVFRTEGEYVELTEAEKDRKKALQTIAEQLAGRSSLNTKWFEKTQAMDTFATTSHDFVDLLVDPDAEVIFAGGGSAAGLFSRAAAHGRSFFADPNNRPMDWVSPEEKVQAVVAANPELGEKWNRLTSDKKALVMELGYALATSREGGRLTDQDVERAIISLGLDNPDPAAIAWIFGRALKRNRDVYARSLSTSGVADLPSVKAAHTMTLESLDEAIARLEEKYQIDYEDENWFDKRTTPFQPRLDKQGVEVGEPIVPSQSTHRTRRVL